ncbi:MAG: hypothetical protein AAGJ50_10575, partial [Pseudomonadota bacterium]
MRLLLSLFIIVAIWQPSMRADQGETLEQVVETLEHKSGFIDLYLDTQKNKIFAALPKPDETGLSVRFIYTTGLTGGLGSNPIGLDRGNASGGIIVGFRKIGNRVVAEQENWRFRASAENPREKLAVAQSFARSFLWSQDIHAE